MTKKSIGEFIAALRKANGMTQKQLAEMLNVSDKAVSRWERDESAPDISLIPIIADVFGVTCDEILRGEKQISSMEIAKPSQKQIEYLFNKTKINFKIRCYIACGTGLLALLFAVMINFAFSKSFIAFIVGCIFLLVAILLVIISIVNSIGSLETKEMEPEIIFPIKHFIYVMAKRTIAFLGLILGLLLPLLLGYIQSKQYQYYSGNIIDTGITILSWFRKSIICVGCIAVILIIINLVLDTYYQTKNQANINLKTLEYSSKTRNLTIKLLVLTAVLFTLTFSSKMAFVKLTDDFTFIKGTTFTDIQEFETYMNEVSYNYDHMANYFENNQYNEFAKNLFRGEITDQDGNIISTFNYRNKKVIGLEVEWNDNIPTITTYNIDDLMNSQLKLQNIKRIWDYAYYFEIIIIICIFIVKRNQLKKHFL